ncbi:MAG: hypothetical protein ABWY77_00250, partial [Acidimicrobiia bacterium]
FGFAESTPEMLANAFAHLLTCEPSRSWTRNDCGKLAAVVGPPDRLLHYGDLCVRRVDGHEDLDVDVTLRDLRPRNALGGSHRRTGEPKHDVSTQNMRRPAYVARRT